MITLLLLLFRLLPFLVGGHRQLALENLALRQQLAVYKRTVTRPSLRRTDRLFWVGLASVWGHWGQPLVIVSPATVLRWRRRRFREYWTRLSGRTTGGRPPVNAEIRHGRREPPLGRPAPLWRDPEARPRRVRAHRVPADAEAAPRALSDLADVLRQPCPGLGLDRFLHRAHGPLAPPLRPRRARPPPPPCPPTSTSPSIPPPRPSSVPPPSCTSFPWANRQAPLAQEGRLPDL